MSRVLKLVTGNVANRQPNKVAETQQILGATLERLGITLMRVDIDCRCHSVEEIQGSAEEVILAKIKEAVKKDGGVVIKWFLHELGPDGLPKLLAGFEDKGATAECRFALARPGLDPVILTGICEGSIVPPRGSRHFGWDPCFQPIGYDQTYAELPNETKNDISHRGKALQALQKYLGENHEALFPREER